MSGSEIAALVASFVSVGIGILAIWVSVKFYEMSTSQAESSREAAKDISAAVNRLEKLFDSLYGDMWSMTKETLAEVRKHAWQAVPGENAKGLSKVAEEANLKFEELRSRVMSQIEEVIQKQKKTDLNLESIKSQLESAVDSGMKAARTLDQEEMKRVIRTKALQLALRLMPCDAGSFTKEVANSTGLDEKSVSNELDSMKADGIFGLDYHPPAYSYRGGSTAHLTKAGLAAAREVVVDN